MTTRRLLFALAFLAAAIFGAARFARAVIDPGCAGNVCSGTLTVGGQAIDWWATQNHDEDDSSLKVRFRSGPYAVDTDPVRFRVVAGSAFEGVSVLKNPSPTTAMPPTQTVNVAQTQVERSALSSTAGQTYDFTFELDYVSPPPGTIAVTLQADQYGDTGAVGPFDISLDPASPTNRDEGEDLAGLYGGAYQQCADAADNDLDYRLDCADFDCDGADIGPTSVCETIEATCNDSLDNDGNGRIDCADPLCNGRPGNPAGTKLCGSENGGAAHANCADGFDNDGNGKTDCHDDTAGTGCWKTGFQGCAQTETSCVDGVDNDRDQDYDEAVDILPGTGRDCRDYDCEGQGNCTTDERLKYDVGSGTFIDDPDQCFNGIDDDLDDQEDCHDVDCLGADDGGGQRCAGFEAYLPQSPLGDGDPLPLFYFNFCTDGLDNDGDGFSDLLDVGECKNRFGECGPSPSTEAYTFLSCANASDDDQDTVIDCGDSQCRDDAKLGRRGCLDPDCGSPATFDVLETDAAACSATEASAAVCGDGLDNDGDGAADCADSGCSAPAQRHGPTVGSAVAPYFCGVETGAATCHDGADNDADLGTDCFDAACQDDVECARRPATGGWTLATCIEVPHTTSPASVVSGGTVTVSHDDRIHVNDPYRMRFVGTASYTSLTIVIGDAVTSANAFPFDAGTGNCSLSGTGASQMDYLSSDPDVGAIIGDSGETIVGFDVMLTCAASSPTPLGPDDYLVSLVANRSTGGPTAVEFGDTTLTVQVFEDAPPTLPVQAVDVEGIVGAQVDVPVGGSVRMQALPDADPSGICRCDFTLEGAGAASPDGECVTTVGPFFNDNASFDVQASATDGADNTSATSSVQTVDVNITPSVEENLTLGVDVNGSTVLTFRAGEAITVAAKFRTETLSTFDPPNDVCRAYIYSAAWAGGLTASPGIVPVALGNTLGCQGSLTVPDLAAGRYWLFLEATDSSGDIVRTNVQAFLQCENSEVGMGACKDADFDHDGAPEGRVTPNTDYAPPGPTYFGAPQPRACDNCVNFFNPNQTDRNANGIGDSCEAGAVGRCRYKSCASGPSDPAPAPGSCSSDADCDPESADPLCVVVNQLMCAINCAVDADCGPPNVALSGVCSQDWGVCSGPSADEGNCCFNGADCLTGECEALVRPFVETLYGQVYSGGDIQASEEPPIDNATYCLQAGGVITNFTSAQGCSLAGLAVRQLPRQETGYVGGFGALDVEGILGGKYGPLTTPASLPDRLEGKIYYFPAGLTVSDPIEFKNSAGIDRANGLVVVKGDLVIGSSLTYEDRNESDLKHLASVGWIVLKDGGSGGNVQIAPGVSSTVGAIFAEGVIDTGGGDVRLDATGMFVAKDVLFKREYASRTEGSERVTFDARVVLNPPPGMADVTRSLPGFRSIPGQ